MGTNMGKINTNILYINKDEKQLALVIKMDTTH